MIWVFVVISTLVCITPLTLVMIILRGLTFQPYGLVASIDELYLFFLSIICDNEFNDLYD